jgi:hypothetical protein
MEMFIVLKLGEIETKLTLEEARKLYAQLQGLFGESAEIYPFTKPIDYLHPFTITPVTCGDGPTYFPSGVSSGDPLEIPHTKVLHG